MASTAIQCAASLLSRSRWSTSRTASANGPPPGTTRSRRSWAAAAIAASTASKCPTWAKAPPPSLTTVSITVAPFASLDMAIVAAMAGLGAPLWLDAGVSSVDHARRVLGLGAARVIVALETLPSFDALEGICTALGGDRVVFSLDLRNGEPVFASWASWASWASGALGATGASGGIPAAEAAHLVAARAAAAGAGAVIVIDLARVGTGTGLDLELIARVREATPGLTLLAGGGVRGLEDFARLADYGCDGALVATALHDGRLGAAEVAAAQRL